MPLKSRASLYLVLFVLSTFGTIYSCLPDLDKTKHELIEELNERFDTCEEKLNNILDVLTACVAIQQEALDEPPVEETKER